MVDVIWRNVTTDGPLNVIRDATSPVLIENVDEDDIEVWVSGEGKVEAAGAPVAPTITSAHISDTQGGTVITEETIGATLWAVANSVTGYPTPTLAYQWEVNGTPPGGTDDEESFDTTGLDDEDVVTVEITVTNPAGTDDATSAGVEVTAPEAVAVTEVAITGSGECWTEHSVSFKLDGNLIEGPGDLPDEGEVVEIQWLRDGVPIEDADDWTYEPIAADDGEDLSVHVTVTIGEDDDEDTSAPLAITNPVMTSTDFSDPGYWDTVNSGWVIEDGVGKKTGGAGTSIRRNLSIVNGRTYRVMFDIVSKAASGNANVVFGAAVQQGPSRTSVGTWSQDILVTQNHTSVGIAATAPNGLTVVDNFNVKRVG